MIPSWLEYNCEAKLKSYNPKKMSHKQLSSNERVVLEKLFRAKVKQSKIAKLLKRSGSTISRELQRNRDKNGKYRTKIANKKLENRRTHANQKFKKLTSKSSLRRFVISKLKKYWSPQQIAGYLERKHAENIIHHEAIYQFAYRDRPDLIKYLRCRKRKYRKRHGTLARSKTRLEAEKRRINVRPEIIEKRERIGDWEGDTIRGGDKKSAVLTHVERKSGYLLANRLERALAEKVRHKTVAEFSKLPKWKCKTITYDNGSEFAEHQTTEIWLKAMIYFAFPYHSWERGTNENTNGLLRQFFPKGTDFTKITDSGLQAAVELINNRPRKRLQYHTPKQVFSGKIAFRIRI